MTLLRIGEFVNWSLVIGDLDLFSDKMRLHCLFRYRYSRPGGNEVHLNLMRIYRDISLQATTELDCIFALSYYYT